MAAINRPPSTAETRRAVAAERVAEFTAEQRRLKEVAAARRAAAASGEKHADHSSPPAPERRSQYLQ
jgi:hypothetical protein